VIFEKIGTAFRAAVSRCASSSRGVPGHRDCRGAGGGGDTFARRCADPAVRPAAVRFAGGIVGLAAFVVTAATAGGPGVVDLARRSLRWRVSVRWYLVALAIYGRQALESRPAAGRGRCRRRPGVFVFQLILFQLSEEIGWTGFLQDRWQDRYGPLRLSVYVAFWWAVRHLPDFFGDEGWSIEQLVLAPVVLVVEFLSLFFARVLFVWMYSRTGRSVLLVAIFHASFDASFKELSYDVVPGSTTARFLIFSAVIVLAATAVIAVTRGRFGGGARPPGIHRGRDAPREQPEHEHHDRR
jgi:membrane protease YdiL (CAAX protease family)